MILTWQLLGSRAHGKAWPLDSVSLLSTFLAFSSTLSPSGKMFIYGHGGKRREGGREGGRENGLTHQPYHCFISSIIMRIS